MVVADFPHFALLQEQPPIARHFLQFFGTVCSISSVERFGCIVEGPVLHCWVRLSDDDEAGQDAIYDALRRFQTADGVVVGTTDLHVVFSDEDISAFPSEAAVLFVRE